MNVLKHYKPKQDVITQTLIMKNECGKYQYICVQILSTETLQEGKLSE